MFLGAPLGALYVLGFRVHERSALDHAVIGAGLAVPTGAFVQVGVPLLAGGVPAWTAAGMAAGVPAVAAWAGAGAAFGVLLGTVADPLAARSSLRFDAPAGPGEPADEPTRVVVLGGGFAGFYAARRLEDLFGPDRSVELTLVSRTNALLFTPMLAEVVGGSLDPTDIATPLRAGLRRTDVVRAEARDVDLEAGRVDLEAPSPGKRTTERPVAGDGGTDVGTDGGAAGEVETRRGTESKPGTGTEDGSGPEAGTGTGTGTGSGPPESRRAGNERVPDREGIVDSVTYDHLVVAVGSVTDYKGLEGVAEFAFEFRTLQDAMRLRSHIIACFERAVRTTDPVARRALLRFVVAGGGFAGAELAGAVNDFVHELLSYYPSLPPEAVEVVLVHSGERIMPELSDSLADYALERMRERGVTFRLESYVEGADPAAGTVSITGDRSLRTETLVWTAGVAPNPLVDRLELPTDHGGVVADSDFSVPGHEGVWAVGDCAHVTDPGTDEPFPPTAEFAVRAGVRLAENVHATVTGRDPRPMRHDSRGALAVIGHQTACAEIGRWRISGLFAWLLWRAVYLKKLPGTERKLRVAVNWTTELFFPRDIVQTLDDPAPEVMDDAG